MGEVDTPSMLQALSNICRALSSRWNRLVEPLPTITNQEDRHRAKLLASLILSIIAVMLVVLPARFLTASAPELIVVRFVIGGISLVGLAVAFWLARRGQFDIAGWSVILGGTLAILLTAALVGGEGGTTSLYYLIIMPLFVSLFYSFRLILLVFCGYMIGIMLLPLAASGITYGDIISGPAPFHILATILIVIMMGYRNRLEAIRKQQIAESEERYKIVSELISDYAYATGIEPDGSYKPEWLTGSFYNVTGYSPDEIEQFQTGPALFHPDDAQAVERDIAELLTGKTIRSEYRIVRKDGSARWLQIDRHPVWNEEENRVVRYFGVAQDITARKEAEMQKLNLALERERLALMSRFVMSVSHDFRNSLANIETSRYILTKLLDASKTGDQLPASRIVAHLDNIHRCVKRLSEQIENLHSVSSLSSKLVEPCDINAIIDAVIVDITPDARGKKLSVRFDAANVPFVFANQTEISRALRHLVANAIAYTPENGEITLRTYTDETYVNIDVIDTGPGIPADHMPYLFDLFYRADTARMIDSGGVGLGLSIAQMIAEAHAGEITVKSDSDKQGATFTLRLPLTMEGDEEPRSISRDAKMSNS